MPTTKKDKYPTKASGYSTDHNLWGTATFADQLETVPDLLWPDNIRTFGRMRYDPQLTGVLSSLGLPIRNADWRVDPSGCRDEVVELVSDDLGIPILDLDPKPKAARRRGVRWEEHLRLALNYLVYGHYPFAQQYEPKDGKVRLIRLAERLPSTISEMNTNDQGELLSIEQWSEDTKIPAHHLLWYVNDREGANWAGKSILRPAYGFWLLKHETLRVHATSIRRFGMGVPIVNAPPGATQDLITQAHNLASSMRVGDQSGVGLPHGFTAEIKGMTGSVPDAVEFVRYLDNSMSKMVLAQAMDLGSTYAGARALSESFIDLFLLSLNAIAKNISDTMTGLAVQMVDYNWGETEEVPRVVCSDVRNDPSVTAESLARLMDAKVLNPDPDLEEYIRKWYRLPPRSEDAPDPYEPGGIAGPKIADLTVHSDTERHSYNPNSPEPPPKSSEHGITNPPPSPKVKKVPVAASKHRKSSRKRRR